MYMGLDRCMWTRDNGSRTEMRHCLAIQRSHYPVAAFALFGTVTSISRNFLVCTMKYVLEYFSRVI